MKKNREERPLEIVLEADAYNTAITASDKNNGATNNRKTINLMVDDVPYIIKATPFSFNGGTRFYISVNGGADHVFTWDPELVRFRSIDDSAGTLPNTLEKAISEKLQAKNRSNEKPATL